MRVAGIHFGVRDHFATVGLSNRFFQVSLHVIQNCVPQIFFCIRFEHGMDEADDALVGGVEEGFGARGGRGRSWY